MKRTLLTVLTFVFASTSAFASGIYEAELTKFNVDERLGTLQSAGSGSVRIDQRRKEATLTLYTRPACSQGRQCMQLSLRPVAITLPIVETKRDECGARTYQAQVERTQGVERMEITDNSQNRCSTFARTADTTVTYSVHDRGFTGMKNSRSTFEGQRFQPAGF